MGTHVHLPGVVFFRCLSSASQTSSIQSGAEMSRSRDFTSYGSKGILPSHTSAFIPRDRCTSSSTMPTCSASLTSPWWVLWFLYLGISCVYVYVSQHWCWEQNTHPLQMLLTARLSFPIPFCFGLFETGCCYVAWLAWHYIHSNPSASTSWVLLELVTTSYFYLWIFKYK